MAGLLIFPALIGTAFKLSPSDTAYLYGVTFMTSGLVVILQSVFLLRLPIVQGPYAGSLAALLAVGHAKGGGLGSAFGSMVVAGLVWCVLAVPLKRFGLITYLSRFVRDPIISAVVVLILATQLTSTALPNWLGTPQSPGFPSVNLIAGAVGAVLVIVMKGAFGAAAGRPGAGGPGPGRSGAGRHHCVAPAAFGYTVTGAWAGPGASRRSARGAKHRPMAAQRIAWAPTE